MTPPIRHLSVRNKPLAGLIVFAFLFGGLLAKGVASTIVHIKQQVHESSGQ